MYKPKKIKNVMVKAKMSAIEKQLCLMRFKNLIFNSKNVMICVIYKETVYKQNVAI